MKIKEEKLRQPSDRSREEKERREDYETEGPQEWIKKETKGSEGADETMATSNPNPNSFRRRKF